MQPLATEQGGCGEFATSINTSWLIVAFGEKGRHLHPCGILKN
jgi:hypothetical protein